MPRFAATLITAATAALAVPANAQQFENLDRLDSIVAMTVGANIGQPGGAAAPVDRRLKLAACPNVPEVSGPVFGAAMVECKIQGWRIRVPLMAGGGNMAQAQRTSYTQASTAQQREAVIKRGDPVQLIAGGSSFTVTRMMIADEDGAVGDLIRVREDRKSDPILARVTENGIVRAPGFKEF
ncbi:MAG: flagella basal body P-ring formation protein FlgA [Sphingobium sp.]